MTAPGKETLLKTSLQYIKDLTDDEIRLLLSQLGSYQTASAVQTVRDWLRKTEGSLPEETGVVEVNHKWEYPEQGTVYLTVWAEKEDKTATASFTLGWNVSYNWLWNRLVIHAYAENRPHLAKCEYSPTGFCDMYDTYGNIRHNFLSNGMSLAEAVHAAFLAEGFNVRFDQLEELYDLLTGAIKELEWNN